MLYFGVNASHPDHLHWTEGYSNTTIAAALTLRTSAGQPIPIFVNTKFTYAEIAASLVISEISSRLRVEYALRSRVLGVA